MVLILPDPPEGWTLRHLISLDPGWQASFANDEYVVIATGSTPADACLAAIIKIASGDHHRFRFYLPPPDPKPGLSALLGLRRPSAPLTQGRKL